VDRPRRIRCGRHGEQQQAEGREKPAHVVYLSPVSTIRKTMARNFSKLQKLAWIFSALFLFVYLLDFVPGIMAENGKMFVFSA